MSAEEKKYCKCESPKLPKVPVGFVGTVICGICKNTVMIEKKQPEPYEGDPDDKVGKYLHVIKDRPLDNETAILITLRGIESAMWALVDSRSDNEEE